MSITKSTIVVYEYSGIQSELTIPFDYLKREFVVVALGGDGKPQKALKLGTDYRFATKTTIVITRQYQPEEGYNKVIIRRVTDASKRIINYQDGSILNASELNTSQLQALHVAEEARDLANYTLFVDDNNNLDARGRKIINLGDPTNPQDAVTKKYVDTASESVIDSRDKTLQYRNEAERFRNEAEGFRDEALASKDEASKKASEISGKIAKADQLNEQAVANSAKAQQYATDAQKSASAASIAEKSAKASDKSAALSAEKAKGYADSLQPETFIKNIETVELLKSSMLPVGTMVKVLGYYNKTDKATHFRIISDSDDGTGVQLSNGLYANIVSDDILHINWVGAKGDGLTDDTAYFTKAFNFVATNRRTLVLNEGSRYLINSMITFKNFTTGFTLKGNNATLDCTDIKKLGYDNNNHFGGVLRIEAAVFVKDIVRIEDLNVVCNRYEHTDSTKREDANPFGGVTIKNFDTVIFNNFKGDSFSFTSGIKVSSYTQCSLSNIRMTNCGRKLNPTKSDTSPYDAAGDAIYLNEFKEGATTNIDNIYCESWAGKYGRGGVVFEFPSGNYHSATITNFTLKGYHRAIHQEDGGTTVCNLYNGRLLDCGIGIFNHGNTRNSKYVLENVNIETSNIDYGSNSGCLVTYATKIKPKYVCINCKFDYKYFTHEQAVDAIFINCVINYSSNASSLAMNGSNVTYKDCNITYGQKVTYNATDVEFDNCIVKGSGDVNIKMVNGKLCIKDSDLTDADWYSENTGSKISCIIGCDIKFNTIRDATIGQGYATTYEIHDTRITDNSGKGLKLYGDGGTKYTKVIGCTFKNVALSYINSAKFTRYLSNNTFYNNSKQFFDFYSANIFVDNSLFVAEDTLIRQPTVNSSYVFNNSYFKSSTGEITYLNNPPLPQGPQS